MAELVADCPRCGASHTTFALLSSTLVDFKYSWQSWYEAFCVCRHCQSATIFVLAERDARESNIISTAGSLHQIKGNVNKLIRNEGYISQKDRAAITPPEHLPDEILKVFKEATTCLAVKCHNACGAMLRLCIDLATKSLLPDQAEGLNAKVRGNLGLRLPWLFDQQILPEALRDLSSCIKEDGNDAAHDGSLEKEDAEDLLDFATALLERIYTEPARLELAKQRREQRRSN